MPSAAAVGAVLDRLTLLAMLSILAAILTAAMIYQFAFGEIPCPLCLLQRFAMFGCCFGLMRQLRSGGGERGSGIALLFAIVLLIISVRQTLLDLFPRPGHEYIGSAVFGIHMPVWSVFIAVALLIGFAARLVLFGDYRSLSPTSLPRFARFTKALIVYVVLLCAINFVAVVVQCGLDECHTVGYRLLG